MERLEFTARVSNTPAGNATLVQVVGSVDPSTIGIFENMFTQFLQEKKFRILLDLSHLKYINSTGMGMMVQLVDKFTEGGGGIVLLNVPPKVMLVMEMLGLQEFFRIADSEEAAVKLMADGGAAKADSDADEDLDELPEADAVPAFAEKRTIRCGHCGAALTVPGSGTFQCARCLSLLAVDNTFSVTTYPEKNAGAAELNVPADMRHVEALRPYFRLFGPASGIDDDGMIGVISATEACARYLISKALADRSTERLRVRVASSAKLLTISIYAAGTALQLKSATLSKMPEFADVIGSVDSLRFEPLTGGNLFIVEKRS